SPVLVGELPGLQRVFLASFEASKLLLVADMEPELDQDHSLVGECALEAVDLVVGAQPLLAGGEALDALHQRSPVPGSIEDGHSAPSRKHGKESPQEVVALLVRGRSGELDHADVTRIDLSHEALDRPTLARGVPALEHHAYRGSQLSLADLTAERQAQLRQTLPGAVERLRFLPASQRPGQIDLVQAAHEA